MSDRPLSYFSIEKIHLECWYLGGLLQQTIADMLGCCLGTVQARLKEHGIPSRSVGAPSGSNISPESNAKRSASHKKIWDERSRRMLEHVMPRHAYAKIQSITKRRLKIEDAKYALSLIMRKMLTV